jgi:small subunit ribosomal protein S9
MAEDETKSTDETSEEQAPQDEAPRDAGPVADEASSALPADDPPSSPPASEAEEDAPAAAAEGEASPADESAVEADEGPGEEAAAEQSTEAPAEPEPEPAREKPVAAEPKKDVIPGADLEPIAVEPEQPELSAEERARLEAEEEERARREAELAAAETESDAASRAPAKMESGARFLATGKRKSSIARVTLLPGDGKFQINGRALEEFFPRPLHQTMVRQPLAVSGYEGNVDVRVRVHGGGVSGQAGAVRHGVARALTEIDAELRGDLKRRGFLTRDARVKERRKAGLKKARKRPQFSKR